MERLPKGVGVSWRRRAQTCIFFFSSRRRHTRCSRDWSSDVCSSDLKTDTECVRFCVKERGGRYVLETKTKVYKLDAQVLAEPWAGQKVRVVGTLDPKTNVITVEKIETEAASPRSSPKPD